MSLDIKHKAVAIIPAAGLGRRFGSADGKTFQELAGKPMLIWAIEALAAVPEVDEVIPVLKESDMTAAVSLFQRHNIPKVRKIAPGGKERQDSVFHGLKLVEDHESIILIHDGARPLIDPGSVAKALSSLADCDGVVLGVPVKDTIKEVSGGRIRNTPKRETLWSIQTPQIFRYQTIFRAYTKAMEEPFYSTDDSALVERYGGEVKVAMGSYTNIKITTPEDMKIAEVLLDMMAHQ